MHPILARLERLAAYLGLWCAIGVLVGAVLTRQGLTWPEALVQVLPPLLVYSFICLSALVRLPGHAARHERRPRRAHGGGRRGLGRRRTLAAAERGVARHARVDARARAGHRAVPRPDAVPARGQRDALPAGALGALRRAGRRGVPRRRAAAARAEGADPRRRAAGAAGPDRPALSLQQPELDQRAHRHRPGRGKADVPAARRLPPDDAAGELGGAASRSRTS